MSRSGGRAAQRSQYDDGSGPIPGPDAFVAVRATYDRALAFMHSCADEPMMNVARGMFYLVAKSLMVDEASTGVQHVEAVMLKGCAAITMMYEHYEYPCTHDKVIAAASPGLG